MGVRFLTMLALSFCLFDELTAAEIYRYDLPANSSPNCKFVTYSGQAGYDFSKDTGVVNTWDGKCARGYLQGYGTLIEVRTTGHTITTKANFDNGMPHGPGSVVDETSKSKTVFLGTFKDGFYSQGTQTVEGISTGIKIVYEGTFLNNRRSGDGSYLYQSRGEKWRYVGKFLDGRINGWGTETVYANGPNDYDYTWTGQFVNGKKNGTGRYSTNKGHYGTAQWANDVEIDSQADAPAQLTPQQLREIFPPQPKIVPFSCTTYGGVTSCQ
ncbi:hypothetical protein [Polynucleobacter sp. UB-Siik-W21]|uniref:hypothetical protein n=1 Tax=Polynucleobacter sp. UB-Siik-W21 TaxID=1855646 RepID=UPI001BFCF4E8|nr:hypothetical protein [Polynucleobacter sp. UB-Siik-W21]QWD69616.1 hypothetical protein C2756_06725 [Polynucleobacter sp. UB-Siik-W21]